jgi:hypothetical protein|tara:strand:- start:2367 stop:2546 length:180 start_codon:yes stop_codon:yes gene_type:complete
MKAKVSTFSKTQLAVSVLPMNESAHMTPKTAMNSMSHLFSLRGTLYFDIAVVNDIWQAI